MTKVELQPLETWHVASKSLMKLKISPFRVFQCALIKVKVKPSDPGALESSQAQTADLISSSKKRCFQKGYLTFIKMKEVVAKDFGLSLEGNSYEKCRLK